MSEELYHALGRLERERNLWRALAIGFAAAFALLLALGAAFVISFQHRVETQRMLAIQAEHEARRQAEVAAEQAELARQRELEARKQMDKAVQQPKAKNP